MTPLEIPIHTAALVRTVRADWQTTKLEKYGGKEH